MPRNGFDEFTCIRIGADDRLPEALGIVLRPATGCVTYWVDDAFIWWRDIGVLAIPEQSRIEVWPHSGITTTDLEVLRGAACEAFAVSPSPAGHWVCTKTPSGRLWETTISVAAG